jgi:hypothetical protein
MWNLMTGIEEQKIHVDQHLRKVLEEESVVADHLREADLASEDLLVVVDAEGVQDHSDQHVFSDERELAEPLDLWEGVVQIFVCFHQFEELNYGIDLHDDKKDPHRPIKRSLVALPKHDKEADIGVKIKPSDLTHRQLDIVPPVYIQKIDILQFSLYINYKPHFKSQVSDRIEKVPVVGCRSDTGPTFFDIIEGSPKGDEVINGCVDVDEPGDPPQGSIQLVKLVSFIFEPESLMFSVNKALPAPNWQDNFLPRLNLYLFILFLSEPAVYPLN